MKLGEERDDLSDNTPPINTMSEQDIQDDNSDSERETIRNGDGGMLAGF